MKTQFRVSYLTEKNSYSSPSFNGFYTIEDYLKKQTQFLCGEVFLRVWKDEETGEERIVNIKDIRSIKVIYIYDDQDEF